MTPEEKIAILEEKIAHQDANFAAFAQSRNELKQQLDLVEKEAARYHAALSAILKNPRKAKSIARQVLSTP